MADDAVPTIQRARLCTKCRYNLYGLAREGACPECGQRYKRRAEDAKAKNPRRQLSQLRHWLRVHESNVRWLTAWWGCAAFSMAACYFLHAGKGWWLLASFTVIAAALRHFVVVFDYREARKKIEDVDALNGRMEQRNQPLESAN